MTDLFRSWWYAALSAYRLRHLPVVPSLRRTLTTTDRLFLLEFYPALRGHDLVVYDIGADIGLFSHAVGSLSNVAAIHAFEPRRAAYAELLEIGKRSPVPVTCHNVALGEVNEQGNMFVPLVSTGSSSLLAPNRVFDRAVGVGPINQQSVTVARLDDYVTQHQLPAPDVVKLDVQGFEDRVVRGGARTVASAAFVIAEVHFEPSYEQSALFDDVYALMRSQGFRLVGMNNAPFGYSSHPLEANAIFARQ